jgi:hypothetical protein
MNTHRRTWLATSGAFLASMALPAVANSPSPASSSNAPNSPAAAGHPWLANSRRIGISTLRVLGMSVYEASLFALADFDPAAFATHPLVLEIHYRRALTGAAIADFSLAEMRRMAGEANLNDGSAERWGQFMRRAFPDVRAGDRITGQWNPASGSTRFAANDGAPHELADAGFGPRFFGIWLAPQTSRPQLREQLLGLKAAS